VSAREYPERPVVGVGAVIIQNKQVLLVQRGHAPMQGEWSLPGGALEVGETLEEGVRREVLEETGLSIQPLAVVEVFDRIARDDSGRVQYHYVLVDFLCRVTSGAAVCGSDAKDLRWTKLDELDGIAPFIRKVIRKAMAMKEKTG